MALAGGRSRKAKKGGKRKTIVDSTREKKKQDSKKKTRKTADLSRKKKKGSGEGVDNKSTRSTATPSTLSAIQTGQCVRSAPDATKQESKKFAHKFVKGTLEKGVLGLRAEFASMKRTNDFTKMKAFVENQPKNKNRYKDVGCLDNSRVILNGGDSDYIHANYVSTPQSDKRFICCQAPLESTCQDFWRMMIQDQCGVILMLCNLTEKGAKKCWEYFPGNKGEEKTFGNITVKCEASAMMTFDCKTSAKVKQSTFFVEVDGKMEHRCDHYHWIDWPDRGVPATDLAVIQLLDRVRGVTTPIVVHCSAGIGRTGSVVLIEYVLEACAEGQACDTVDSLLEKLRKQRNASVQTDHQYLFIHSVLLEYFYKKGFLDKSVAPLLTSWMADYNKAVII